MKSDIKRRKEKMMVFSQILSLIIEIFAFSFIIGGMAIGASENISATTSPIPIGCCPEANDGSICQEMNRLDESDCKTDLLATSCNTVDNCQSGCCYNPTEGSCSLNSPKQQCQQNGGNWSNSATCEIAQCQIGCCILGNQASTTTSRECTLLSREMNFDKNFQSLDADGTCNSKLNLGKMGACTVSSGDYSGENDCKFTTKGQCTGMFYEDYLCTAPELNTNCYKSKNTTCASDKDQIYYQDTCGNIANVYDANKFEDVAYWTKVISPLDSCSPSNPNCGNCDYLTGSICANFRQGKDIKSTFGDKVCRDLNCANGKKNGESWCISDYDITLSGIAPIGARNFVGKCSNGELSVEPCADFNNEICVSNQGSSFSEAKCIGNDWRSCLSANLKGTYAEVENECKKYDQCIMFLDIPENEKYLNLPGFIKGEEAVDGNTARGNAGDVGKEANVVIPSCVPKYTPGLVFWNTQKATATSTTRKTTTGTTPAPPTSETTSNADYGGSLAETEAICKLGSFVCVSHKQKNGQISDWKDKENWACNSDAENSAAKTEKIPLMLEALNERCRSLGPCGIYVNVAGELGSNSIDNSTITRTKIDTGGKTVPNQNKDAYVISEDYTSSLAAKSNLKKMGSLSSLTASVILNLISGNVVASAEQQQAEILAVNGVNQEGSSAVTGAAEEQSSLGQSTATTATTIGALAGYGGTSAGTGALATVTGGTAGTGMVSAGGAIGEGVVSAVTAGSTLTGGTFAVGSAGIAGTVGGTAGGVTIVAGSGGAVVGGASVAAGTTVTATSGTAFTASAGSTITPVAGGTANIVGGAAGGAVAPMSLLSIAGWALAAAAAGYLVGTLIGKWGHMSPGETQALSYALAAGAGGGVAVALLVNNEYVLLWPVGTILYIIVVIIAVLIWALTGEDNEYSIVTYTCEPWTPPLKGDCNLCNDDIRTCSEYRCKSLGLNCQYYNTNGEPGWCASQDETWSATIKPWQEALTAGNKYTEITSTHFKIEGNNSDGTVKAWQNLEFGITTDKPAQCKIDNKHTASFDEMSTQMLIDTTCETGACSENQGLNHKIAISENLGTNYTATSTLGMIEGENNYYIRCKNFAGLGNTAEFAVKFTLGAGQDLTPPQVISFIPPSNSYLKVGANSSSIIVYVNEPSECKYSQNLDNRYVDMTGNLSCVTDPAMARLGNWPCFTQLNNFNVGANNFYFKCQDQPNADAATPRNTNEVSKLYTLNLCEKELNITSLQPENQIITGSLTISTELKVTTTGCVNNGQAVCKYAFNNGIAIDFLNTNSNQHSQPLDSLPAGENNLTVTCQDVAGNLANITTKLTVIRDITAPRITRVFKLNDLLEVITNENSECKYNLNSSIGCDFNLNENYSLMDSRGVYHYTPWLENQQYYIKCQDQYNNSNLASCGATIETYEI